MTETLDENSKLGAKPAPTPPAVWDPVVRLNHWTLAAVVIANGLINKAGGSLHIWLGWVAMCTLAVRLVWGLAGPREARFSSFPPAPRAALAHLRSLLRGHPAEHTSHNPAGALMVYTLWGCIAAMVLTGLVMTRFEDPFTIAAEKAAVAAGDWSVLTDANGGNESVLSKNSERLIKDVHGLAANLIYAKAGISGRAQFAAWFVEDLLD